MRDYQTLHLRHLKKKTKKNSTLFAALHFSYCWVFNNDHNSYLKMSVKLPVA